MKRFRLFKHLYNGLNWMDSKFFQKNYPEYQSKFANQVLIVTAISIGTSLLLSLFAVYALENATVIYGPVIHTGVLSIYTCTFLVRQWRFLVGPWRKIGYVIFCAIFLVILGPFLFSMLVLAVLLSIAIQLALFVLSIILMIISLFSGGSSSSRKRWKLDNGDTVEESKGLFGESYYSGAGGKSYDKHGDDYFSEK